MKNELALKNQSILEIVKGDRVYSFTLPANAPCGEAHDVLYEMKAFVIQRMGDDKHPYSAVCDDSTNSNCEVTNAQCAAI